MKNKSKLGMISPNQLMLLVFVSRVAVSLTNVQAISVGDFAPDLLVSVVIAYLIVMLCSLPIMYCIKCGKNPLDNRLVAFLYSIYFTIYTAITITRFSYFASTKMNPEMSTNVFLIIMSIAMCYGAYLGLESISRFGSFCAVLLGIVVLVVSILNVNKFEPLYFYPSIVNSKQTILNNAILFASNSTEISLVLALNSRVNGDSIKALFKGISLSFLSIMVLISLCIGVLGASANLQAFPIFSVFQMASSRVLSRLDIIHTSFWILGVFMKCSLLIFCANLFTKRNANAFRSTVFSVISFLLAFFGIRYFGVSILAPTKIVVFVCFVVFAVVIPLASLLIKRRSSLEKI